MDGEGACDNEVVVVVQEKKGRAGEALRDGNRSEGHGLV